MDIGQSASVGQPAAWKRRHLSGEKKYKVAFYRLLFIFAFGIRSIDVMRPIDGTIWDSYREPEFGGIARNFYAVYVFLDRLTLR